MTLFYRFDHKYNKKGLVNGDDENRVYIIYTVTSIAEDIGCSKDKAGRILSELDSLKGIGLVERKRRGLGRPDIIYVKNFVKFIDNTEDEKRQNNYKTSGDSKMRLQETSDCDFKKPQNTISGDRNLRLQEAADCDSNKTEINNTEYNNISSSSRGFSRPISLVDNRKLFDEDEEVLKQIRENILYDWHMRTDSGNDRELYQELYEVIKDMVIGERETVTALFNAPATINTHYSQLVTCYEEGDGRQIWDTG